MCSLKNKIKFKHSRFFLCLFFLVGIFFKLFIFMLIVFIMYIFFLILKILFVVTDWSIAQSAGDVECSDCASADGVKKKKQKKRSDLYMTLNNLMIRLQWSWGFGECGGLLHCDWSQVYIGPEYGPIYGLNRINCVLMLNWIVWIRTVWVNWKAWNRNVYDN